MKTVTSKIVLSLNIIHCLKILLVNILTIIIDSESFNYLKKI